MAADPVAAVSTASGLRTRAFHAMGTDAHVLVLGGPPAALDLAVERLAGLEARWSRFLPDSELSWLRRAKGQPLQVSPDTMALLTRSAMAWSSTEGRFDPTVIEAMERLGYDRSFEHLPEDRVGGERGSVPAPGLADLVLDHRSRTARLPAGVGFDPGGIGKGFAADLTVKTLLDLGCDGALVNLGGDLSAGGAAPDPAGWGITPPPGSGHGVLVLTSGGLATSSSQRRTWKRDGHRVHHLIDPRTGDAIVDPHRTVTVIAGEAWWAEALTKAVMCMSVTEAASWLPSWGATGLIVDAAGERHHLPGIEEYLR